MCLEIVGRRLDLALATGGLEVSCFGAENGRPETTADE